MHPLEDILHLRDFLVKPCMKQKALLESYQNITKGALQVLKFMTFCFSFHLIQKQ